MREGRDDHPWAAGLRAEPQTVFARLSRFGGSSLHISGYPAIPSVKQRAVATFHDPGTSRWGGRIIRSARLRGVDPPDETEAAPRETNLAARKREWQRATVEAVHPPEIESEVDEEAEAFRARVLAPKASYAELVRRIHGSEEAE